MGAKMYKLLRFYNQNRIKIWGMIIAIILLIAMIQVVNSAIKEQNIANQQAKEEETTLNNVVSYDKQSESIISGGSVSKTYQEVFGDTINTFLTYCINNEIQKAYDMLSMDMKKIKYSTELSFAEGYCKDKFNGNMQYSFQSWSTANKKNIYVVNIYENMLATGKTSKESYIEDYITIVPEEDTYKINVDGYIGRNYINKEVKDENVNLKVIYVDQYMNYEIYTFQAKNNTNQSILLDPQENTKNTYIVDDKQNKFDALVYENKREDLTLGPQENKIIQIKFSDVYRTSLNIIQINFNKIVKKEEYLLNKKIKGKALKIEI